MTRATRQMVIVKAGGVIEIRDPQLPEGAVAEVIVLVEAPAAMGRVEDRGRPSRLFEQTYGRLRDQPLACEDVLN